MEGEERGEGGGSSDQLMFIQRWEVDSEWGGSQALCHSVWQSCELSEARDGGSVRWLVGWGQ